MAGRAVPGPFHLIVGINGDAARAEKIVLDADVRNSAQCRRRTVKRPTHHPQHSHSKQREH